ncbi:helix-turn-helix domain-containing protein [Leisingera daeponensis]|uniref:helix-turn-helix domain-containing protein n=1 Tax=Leisingera daeponensis TaxID=405746 RepID=UPI001C941D5D|nr:helix-turn-helix domain-containing protein [Leisingera daeponensis]MBY6055395.1 helix-turn-helix domain-containing protein [Leisingera daeponensis]
MSVKAISWAYEADADLDVYEAFILVTLADQADDYGICWALNRTMQEKCRCSERKVSMALKRLQEVGLIVQVHRRRSNGSKRSSLFILTGWDERKLVDRVDDHPALQQLHVEGVEEMTTIIPHVVRDAPGEEKAVDNPKATRTTCPTLPHDMRDPPAQHAGLEPSIEPKKRTNPLTPSPDSPLSTAADLIRSGKRFLCTRISAHTARQCVEAKLVTIEEVRTVGIPV